MTTDVVFLALTVIFVVVPVVAGAAANRRLYSARAARDGGDSGVSVSWSIWHGSSHDGGGWDGGGCGGDGGGCGGGGGDGGG